MIKEPVKFDNRVNTKTSKIRTQKVSLCLASSKQKYPNQKSTSLCQNLNIKFKTTKSSPEKTLLCQDDLNNPNNIIVTHLQPQITEQDKDTLRQKIIKKQLESQLKTNNPNQRNSINQKNTTLNNITQQKTQQENNMKIKPSNKKDSKEKKPNNLIINKATLKHHLFNLLPQSSLIKSHNPTISDVSKGENSSQKKRPKISVTSPATNQNSKKTSVDNKIINKQSYQKGFQNKKNSILTNITRHTEQNRKSNNVQKINLGSGNIIFSTTRSAKSNQSTERVLPLYPQTTLNLKNLLSANENISKPNLTTGNSPNRCHLKFNSLKGQQASTQKDNISNNHKSNTNDKSKQNNPFLNNKIKNSPNKIYNIRRKKGGFTSANSKDILGFHKRTGIEIPQSKSTSHSVSKRKMNPEQVKKFHNSISKKYSIPNKASSKQNSRRQSQKGTKKKINTYNKHIREQKSIKKEDANTQLFTIDKRDTSFSIFNQSINSNKSILIKEGTYYAIEADKLTIYIKSYYQKFKDYPNTNISFYKFGRLIGRGAFGKVNIGLHVLTGRIVAIKSFNKKSLENDSAKAKIFHETNLMKMLRHNSIVKILETFETDKYLLIVMEHIAGGNLLSFLKKRSRIQEKMAKIIFRQLINAIKFIHSKGIIHRDIKLDNILMDLNNNIKICDFGVGKQVKEGDLLIDQCGTPAYIAPEILKNEGYEGPPVDLWSSGVVLYAMLSGTVPFKANNLNELNKIIQKGEYPQLKDVSIEAKNLIRCLLEVDPKKRITADKVLNHQWFFNMNANEESKISLLTKAELILLSKSNIDYRTCPKEEMIENFTLKNLITSNDNENKNIITKSIILAPFNSSYEGDGEDMEESEQRMEEGLKLESNVLHFENKVKILNRHYELNNNKDFDHSILIKRSKSKSSSSNSYKSQNEELILQGMENDEEFEFKDEQHNSCVNMNEYTSKKNSQRNVYTSITNSSTLIIDETIIKILEGLGYQKDYIQKSLINNDLNYCTAGYYLLSNLGDLPC